MQEIRTSPRKNNDRLMIEIPLSIPKNYTLDFEIHDISNDGISFLVPAEIGFFYKDTILYNIKIYNKDSEILVSKAQVAYCLSDFITSDVSKYYKVGLNFLKDKNCDNIKIRKKRFSIGMLGNIKGKVKLKDNCDTEYDGKLIDFSLYGLSFSLKKSSFIPQMGSVIDLKVSLDDKIVYNGKGVLKDFKDEKNITIFRVILTSDVFNLDEIIGLRLDRRIKDEEKIVNNFFSNSEIISSEYKTIIADITYILSGLKKRFDIFEKELPKDNEEIRNKLINQMFEDMGKNVFPKINLYTDKLDKIAEQISKEEHEIYKDYYQKILHSFIIGGSLPNRIITKPLGFPGDYEMMNMIYRNSHEGISLFDKFVHTYFCSISLSQANRNRSEYLYEKIKNYQNKLLKPSENIKITSIACGSAIEIQKYISREKLSDKAIITLLDFEKEALHYSKSRLKVILSENKRSTNLKFVEESIFNMLKNKKSLNKIDDEQDIIYSIGLFEYLSVSVCQKLIEVLYTKLKKGGLLILGNYAKGSPFKSWMELGVEWYLIYRNNDELFSMASNINNDKINIEQEPLGIIKFLVIEK